VFFVVLWVGAAIKPLHKMPFSNSADLQQAANCA
jgi:hypothetical protein